MDLEEQIQFPFAPELELEVVAKGGPLDMSGTLLLEDAGEGVVRG